MSGTVSISMIHLGIAAGSFIVLIISGAFGAARWGANWALKAYDNKLEGIQKYYDQKILDLEESQKERKTAFREMQLDIGSRVHILRCKDERDGCDHARSMFLCGVTTQITNVAMLVKEQDEKRQIALKENGERFEKIMIAITKIGERSNQFRPPEAKDLIR